METEWEKDFGTVLSGVSAIAKYLYRDPNSILTLKASKNLPCTFIDGLLISYTSLIDEWTTSRVRESIDLDTDWDIEIKRKHLPK